MSLRAGCQANRCSVGRTVSFPPRSRLRQWRVQGPLHRTKHGEPARLQAAFDTHMLGGNGYALLLSTLAGLSTSIGGALAVTRKPDDASLAFLLGTAIGVMATVSAVELWIRNALAGHPAWVTASVLAGAATFCLLEPLLPKEPELEQQQPQQQQDAAGSEEHIVLYINTRDVTAGFSKGPSKAAARAVPRQASLGAGQGLGSPGASASLTSTASMQQAPQQQQQQQGPLKAGPVYALLNSNNNAPDSPASSAGSVSGQEGFGSSGVRAKGLEPTGKPAWGPSGMGSQHPGLLRLGLLMAVTMTLHNLPEGFAVAFASFTDVGPLMAVAIALHNIPEGVVVAAPIYAATGSRWRALGIATASGLSEPLGAAIALLLVKPFVDSVQRLEYVLAFVGGVMLAVCVLELWPEGRKCRHDKQLLQGIALGCVVMGWTLYLGV